MSELNREQIIKALKCCVKVEGFRDTEICRECPLHDTQCAILLPQNALSLINSQEQDKEKLGLLIDEIVKEKRELFEENKRLTEENERLRDELAKSYETLDESINFYCSFTKSKVSNCPIDDEVTKAKADTVREIFEKIEKRIASLEYQANTQRKTISVEELKAQVNWILHEVVPQTLAELKKEAHGG